MLRSILNIVMLLCPVQGFFPQSCPDLNLPISEGYTESHGKHYKLYSDEKTFLDAQLTCHSVGARLAMVKSQEDLAGVREHYQSKIL